jgi:hypothetical protein
MIEYLPSGEVRLTFDDGETYTLRRPKFGQWRKYRTEISQASEDAQATLAAHTEELRSLAEALSTAKPKDREALQEAADQAAADLSAFAATPFYETTSEIVRRMFAELGDRPLPEDRDTWPVYLVADVTVPGKILGHWQTAPLASGAAADDVR